MSEKQNANHNTKYHDAACSRVLFDGADAIRGGIADIQKGLASLFQKNTTQGKQIIADGTQYIQKGVSQMRKKLTEECLIKDTESYDLILSGIEYELQAVALLKEGIGRYEENRSSDGLQDVVHGLYLAEKGLNDLTKGGAGFRYQDNRNVLREIHESVKDIQECASVIEIGLDHMSENRQEKSEKTIANGIDNLTKVLDRIHDSLHLFRDEDPEFFRLVLEGVQMVDEGQKKIKTGADALFKPSKSRGCPICSGTAQIEEGLSNVQEGVRDIRKGLSLLHDSDGSRA